MASLIFCLVSSEILAVPLITLDTVDGFTPTFFAMSLIVAGIIFSPIFLMSFLFMQTFALRFKKIMQTFALSMLKYYHAHSSLSIISFIII